MLSKPLITALFPGPCKNLFVKYTVTYKRRKVGPELNTMKKREPL